MLKRMISYTRIVVFVSVLGSLLSSLGWLERPDVAEGQRGTTIGQYERFETVFPVRADYENPYNPDEIRVAATFTAPSGTRFEVPGFYMQPYEDDCRDDTCFAESLVPVGDGEWRVRFSPPETGDWTYRIVAIVNGDERDVRTGSFKVVASSNPGFIRIAANQRYFEFDNGTAYFPIGQNLGWSWEQGGGIYTYIEWLDRLEAAGANYARLNIDVPWFIGIEWGSPPGQYGESGQEAAWRLDSILEAAQERGIYLQVTMIWHQAFRDYNGLPVNVPRSPSRPDVSSDFDNHPYNVRQGGNMQVPGDIFFNTLAQDWLERRLYYIVARWGFSPNIFAWEIVDRLDQIAGFTPERDIEWLNDLIARVRDADPHQHLVTVGSTDFQPAIEENANIDFSQSRIYQRRPIEQAEDQVQITFSALSETLSRLSRPVTVTEFSLNPWFEPTADDPEGIHIRKTIWATALSGAAGSAMPTWWDTYIAPQDLFSLYAPLALFTDGVPWNTANLQMVEPILTTDAAVEYAPLRIEDFSRQFRVAPGPEISYRITSDGAYPPTSRMSSYLYGTEYNTRDRQPQSLVLTPPVDTTLTIGIRSVSTAADAQLIVSIDEVNVATLDLSSGTEGTNFTIPITAGTHKLGLDNQGADWLQLEYLEIAQYRAPLRAMALADRDQGLALVWVQHRDYTWENIQSGVDIAPLNYRLSLDDMPAGEYRVEFWDTTSGAVIGEEVLLVSGEAERGQLQVDLLPITDQLALRIFRTAGPAAETAPPQNETPTGTPAPPLTPGDTTPEATIPARRDLANGTEESSPTP
ncbi:MAG: DUF5060 domain-containing protein [Chloroflexi bacterium]|nr:DUF5060 domain-containing protein [Chloroflexota bacterium]